MVRRNILNVIFLLCLTTAFPAHADDSKNAASTTSQNIKEAEAYFQRDRDKILNEISTYLESGSFWIAKTRSEIFLSTNDPELKKLHDKSVAELQKIEEEEKRKRQEKQQAEEAARKEVIERQKKEQGAQENYELTGSALDQCKHEIAKFLHTDGSGQIPDVKNFGTGNEFVFGWGRGSFQMNTAFGMVDMSASCDGSLKPLKVMSMSINGETVILNGKPYL
jgi:hypothetical protein